MKRRPPPRRSSRGLTLFEVLIVVALVAMLGTAIIFGSGMLSSARMRQAATLTVMGVRVATTRASTNGYPVRLVFDMETQSLLLEATHGPMLRQKDEGESTGAGADPATEAEQEARAEADRILQGPQAARASFTAVKDFAPDAEDPSRGRKLPQGVRFRQVQTEHDGEPRTTGRAYLYFWPGGGTERAAIQLERDGDPEGVTVLVNALTGRAKIEKGQKELEQLQDEDFGESEDDE